MEYNGMNKRKKKHGSGKWLRPKPILKTWTPYLFTHGQSIIIYGSEVAPESNSMICRAKTDWHGGPVGASTPKCKVQPTNNMEKKTALMCCLVRGGSFPCVEWRTTWGITPKPWQPKLPNSWVFVSSCWTPGHDQALPRWMTFPETIVSEKYRLG